MKITADTNVLLRAVMGDDPRQSRLAQQALSKAELVAVPLPVLCEFVWVLAKGHDVPPAEIAETIRALVESGNVVTNRPAVEAGLALLEAGGDFADGAITFEGAWLGAETFLSFDRKAVRLVAAQGGNARLLS